MDDAVQPLIASIQQCPYIWSTWQELSSVITSAKMVSTQRSELIKKLDGIWPKLPHNHIMTKYFLSIVNQEFVERASTVRDFLDEIQSVFPSSLNVKAHRALIHYHARGHSSKCVLTPRIR